MKKIPSKPTVAAACDVSFVLPCLDEALSLQACIGRCDEAVAELWSRLGLRGEILVADNGSTDGSQALATRLGARVVPVAERGYGAALRGGFQAARGRYLVMGDADGSYDFREAVAMVEALARGADLCMGSRFMVKGSVKPGAMPWKNRYIGNPVLTGVLNLLFGAKVGDAHCGLRALTRACFDRLGLTGSGMEFASEMVIKAALKGERIVESPATLSPDLRDRPPHLRPWRDGWRHLRYLLMLSPMWVFGLPAMVGAVLSIGILSSAGWSVLAHRETSWFFGNYWTVLAGSMLGLSHIAAILAFASHQYGVREGYRTPRPWMRRMSRALTLESMIIAGVVTTLVGLTVLGYVLAAWTASGQARAESVFPAVLGTSLTMLGWQNILGGFLLAILSGNEAKFVQASASPAPAAAAGPEDRHVLAS
jgi:glycosyltransferase involved in cell wall biosynthesis